jgi:hypothetical protein
LETRLAVSSTTYIHMEAKKKVDEISKGSKLEMFMAVMPFLVYHAPSKIKT